MNRTHTIKSELVSLSTPPESARLERAPSPQRPQSVLIVVVAAIAIFSTVTFEYATYQHYFKRYVAPYYPVNFDQLDTYQTAYKSSLNSAGKTSQTTVERPIGLPVKRPVSINMKGALVPLTSQCTAWVMGPHRFSVGVVNFLYLIVGQLVLFFAICRRSGIRAALLASGLFLFSGSHYFYAGGLNDMRLDYAGMIMMGITYLAMLQSLECGRRQDFVLAFVCLIVCVATRSIILFYWLGTAFGVFATASLLAFRNKSVAVEKLHMRSLVILAGAVFVVTFYVAINWSDFASYYINCKTGGEDAMRRHENHVDSFADILLYYPRSFLEHFRIMLSVGFFGAIASVASSIYALKRKGGDTNRAAGAQAESTHPRESVRVSQVVGRGLAAPVVMLPLCLLISVLVCVTAYAPSPLVIGVLTMPVCISLGLAVNHLMAESKLKFVPLAIAVAIAGSGLWYFNSEFKTPRYPPQPNVAEAHAVDRIFAVLARRVSQYHRPIKILWAIVHGGINEKTFEVYWYEHLHRSVNVSIIDAFVAAYPQCPWKGLCQELSQADLVVTPIELPALTSGSFDYEGMKSVRSFMPQILSQLQANGFVQVYACSLSDKGPPVIAIFQRQPHGAGYGGTDNNR